MCYNYPSKFIRVSNNQPVNLIKELGGGGEGTVFTTDLTGLVAKRFDYQNPEVIPKLPQKIEKLKIMLANPPEPPTKNINHPSITWPVDLLKTPNGDIIGYLMPSVENSDTVSKICVPKIRKNPQQYSQFNLSECHWYHLHLTAQNIASVIESLHNKNYIIGDMKPDNILVTKKAIVSIIDTDSFQVPDPISRKIYPCEVGTPSLVPPEILSIKGIKFDTFIQTKEHDYFRLAITIHYLLFGTNPFHQGKWMGQADQPDTNERIKQGLWIYNPNNLYTLVDHVIPLDIVHPEIKQCFLRCFNDGYKNLSARPTGAEWKKALEIAITDLKQCQKEPNHYYSNSYGSCYWCERKNNPNIGSDIFEVVQPQNQATSTTIPNQTPLTPISNTPKPQPKPKTKQPLPVPQVQLSSSVINLTATKSGEVLNTTIAVNNFVANTLLQGNWSVASHSNDGFYPPNAHPWISFSSNSFSNNNNTCNITIDTSKLMDNQSYERELILSTNSAQITHSVILRVQTAKSNISIKQIPYLLLIKYFGLALMLTWGLKYSLSYIFYCLGLVDKILPEKSQTVILAGVILGPLIIGLIGFIWCFMTIVMIIEFITQQPTQEIVEALNWWHFHNGLLFASLIGASFTWGLIFWLGILNNASQKLSSLTKNISNKTNLSEFVSSLLILSTFGLGISSGMKFLLKIPAQGITFAIIGTALALAGTIAFSIMKQRKSLAQYQQNQKRLIKP